MNFLLRVVVNACAIWVAAWILPGVAIEGNQVVEDQTGTIAATIISYLVVGLIFGLANAFIKPILSFVSAPITCLTLGLFSIVINAVILALTSWLSGFTPFEFTIDSFFPSAIIAAVIVSIVSALLGWLVPERSTERD
ncbi:MAG: phage holin family protein [Brevibacterium aurantiacum]|uniref:Phage holin family protein n=1 Tax=Brevibacterium aurantiacum TaxID=273384 RepID=A0A1D7W3N3_BREAU|nr:phage holin family protein [Brevibacterium aurantiacum]MDN5551411.1 phage holin family protein [Brevibacterium sp.]AOP53575.1 putative CONSERVED MEMBRANE PROTEIN [Brevibacterium aurantiacum]AZL12972.1 phage holin family protein [Brevibacterium aurantiacum]AZT97243.1 phage holin family protein [Brevibacterium aurantiacum]MDN5592499.1 phage holin family protein [Brevibacterium sp.]